MTLYKVPSKDMVLLVKLSNGTKIHDVYKHFLQCGVKSLWNSSIVKIEKLSYTNFRLDYVLKY